MTETMSIEQYLGEGGVLSSPANVPPRYRGELLRLMASFVDSELAGSAGFADVINDAPGIQERISAARTGRSSPSSRSRSNTTGVSGSCTILPLTATRPARTHCAATVRDATPSFDKARATPTRRGEGAARAPDGGVRILVLDITGDYQGLADEDGGVFPSCARWTVI